MTIHNNNKNKAKTKPFELAGKNGRLLQQLLEAQIHFPMLPSYSYFSLTFAILLKKAEVRVAA
jgi:hypothetical protein